MRTTDEHYMSMAINEARKAAKRGEIPVGAVVIKDGAVISRGFNLRESKNDPLAHAELIAIKKAAKKLGAWRLTGVTLYVTLEPCIMCMGAIIQARIPRLVFAARDEKAGACGSVFDLSNDARLNHRVKSESGILQSQAQNLLTGFFLTLRKRNKCTS